MIARDFAPDRRSGLSAAYNRAVVSDWCDLATNAVIEGAKEAGLAPGEGVRAALAGPEQPDLWDEEEAAADAAMGPRPVGYRGGRKPGSKNRATRDVIEYVRRAGVDPLIWQSRILSMSPTELMEFGGFKRCDALEFQRKIADSLSSTLYPGKTVADVLQDAIDKNLVPVMGFMAMAGQKPDWLAPPDIDGRRIAGEDVIERVALRIEENQGVSHADPV